VAEWVRVASTSDCRGEGCLHATAADGTDVVIVRAGGEWFALEDRCSHQDFPLSDGDVEGEVIECIYHGAKFDLRTGKALSLPAIRPVKTFPVEIRGEDVYVQMG
jgi:3-phenylpropionate/trans-cinnamate dioxygenase ferredoxin component